MWRGRGKLVREKMAGGHKTTHTPLLLYRVLQNTQEIAQQQKPPSHSPFLRFIDLFASKIKYTRRIFTSNGDVTRASGRFHIQIRTLQIKSVGNPKKESWVALPEAKPTRMTAMNSTCEYFSVLVLRYRTTNTSQNNCRANTQLQAAMSIAPPEPEGPEESVSGEAGNWSPHHTTHNMIKHGIHPNNPATPSDILRISPMITFFGFPR